MPQLHRRLSTEQVKAILIKYTNGDFTAKQAAAYLEIGRTRFYQLVHAYQEDSFNFSVHYTRVAPTRQLDPAIERNILQELKIEKEKIIDNPDVATKQYNYSYIQNVLREEHDQVVSLPTVIDRARRHGYWKEKPSKNP